MHFVKIKKVVSILLVVDTDWQNQSCSKTERVTSSISPQVWIGLGSVSVVTDQIQTKFT